MSTRALFVFDRDNWCYVFPSVEDTENGLEANDVDADEYVVLDQDGTVFESSLEGLDVRLRATDVRDPALLQDRLSIFMQELRIKCTSEDVIDIGNAILRAAWEDRWPRRPRWLARHLHGNEPPTL